MKKIRLNSKASFGQKLKGFFKRIAPMSIFVGISIALFSLLFWYGLTYNFQFEVDLGGGVPLCEIFPANETENGGSSSRFPFEVAPPIVAREWEPYAPYVPSEVKCDCDYDCKCDDGCEYDCDCEKDYICEDCGEIDCICEIDYPCEECGEIDCICLIYTPPYPLPDLLLHNAVYQTSLFGQGRRLLMIFDVKNHTAQIILIDSAQYTILTLDATVLLHFNNIVSVSAMYGDEEIQFLLTVQLNNVEFVSLRLAQIVGLSSLAQGRFNLHHVIPM